MFEVSSLIVSLCVHASVSVARVCVGVGGCVCGVALGSSWVTRALCSPRCHVAVEALF